MFPLLRSLARAARAAMLVWASFTPFVGTLRAQVPADTLVAAEPLPTAAALAQLPTLGHAVVRGDETVPDTLPRLFGVYPNGFVSVMLLTPRSVAGIVRDDSLDAHVRACMPNADNRSYRPPHPWARLDSATADRAFVLLQVDVPLPATPTCLRQIDPRVRGADIQVVEPHTTVRAVNDITGAAVLLRGQPLAPALVARARVAALDANGRPLPALPHDLRVYLAPDALGPDRHGRFPEVELWLTTADTTRVPMQLPVSDTAVAKAWRELTSWRLTRLDGQPHTTSLPRLREPRDTMLRSAASLYAAGELISAAIAAARAREQLGRTRDTRSDAQFADLLVGSVFVAYGDSAGARDAYVRALRSAPCLHLTAHPAFDAQLAALRPADARCQSLSRPRQLASGLLLPGGAQWVRGNRLLAGIAAAATTTLFAFAVSREQTAQRQYDAYRSAIYVPPLTMSAMLASANASRAAARTYALRAASVWVGSAVAGLVQEAVHSRHVRGEEQYESAAGTTR